METNEPGGLHYPDPQLATPAFVLRPWKPTDADAVFESCSDPVTQRFITVMPRPYTRQHAETFLERSADLTAQGIAGHSDPVVIGGSSWDHFKFVVAGDNGVIYAVVP
jgi:RimJ/RimL family protein N-acetyltransferase